MSTPAGVLQVANPTLAGGASEGPRAAAAASGASTEASPSGRSTSSPAATSEAPSSKPSDAKASTPPSAQGGAASSQKPPADSAADASAKPGDKPAEGEKPEQKTRTAAVILAEREARLVENAKALKTEREQLIAEREAHKADLAAAKAILEGARGKSRLAVVDAAAKAAGVSRADFIEALQDEYLAGLREPTAEELATKTKEQIKAELLAEQEQAQKAKADAEAKKLQEMADTGRRGYLEAVEAHAKELGPKFAETYDLCAAFDVGPERVLAKALEMFRASGGKATPSPAEALAELEKELAGTVGKSKKFRAAEAAAAAAPEEKQAGTARDKAPGTLTTKGAGSVALTPKPKPTEKKSALERLAEARREMGDVGN